MSKVFETITLKGVEGSFELCQPNFDVYALALSNMIKGEGKVDIIGAGRIVFDACYLGNNGTLEDVQSDPKLYASLSLQAGSLVEFFEGDIKKN